jgi:hypothetical protein
MRCSRFTPHVMLLLAKHDLYLQCHYLFVPDKPESGTSATIECHACRHQDQFDQPQRCPPATELAHGPPGCLAWTQSTASYAVNTEYAATGRRCGYLPLTSLGWEAGTIEAHSGTRPQSGSDADQGPGRWSAQAFSPIAPRIWS